jgi:predicted ATP-grasp superfamily ATP-dependent carboligase
MKLVLYEWCCSGGLHGPDAAAFQPGGSGATGGLMAEGAAMLAALALDALRDTSLDVVVLVDAAAPSELVARLAATGGGVSVRRVKPGAELDDVAAAATRADWTLLVAPETGGLLATRVAAVRRAGGRPVACGSRFIDIAGDKQATATALAAAGVPVPAGRSLAAGEPLPDGFHLPAVCKARDGVGCDGLRIVRSRPQEVPTPTPRRVEAYASGMPVGVSCLCGPAVRRPLAPVIQRFSPGERPRYLGGAVAGAASWRRRAESLAERAIAAVVRAGGAGEDAAAAGWVGVDMVLGAGEDGRGDRVLEVNPRLTTSFVGLAALEAGSLVRLLIDTAAGLVPQPRPLAGRSVDFDASGAVRIRDA